MARPRPVQRRAEAISIASATKGSSCGHRAKASTRHASAIAAASCPVGFSVRFAIHKPDAKGVSVCGEFNGWSSNATPMRRDSSGHWETTVALTPGRYQYKFVVDGEWIPDPLTHENVWNQHGTLNSVVEVRA